MLFDATDDKCQLVIGSMKVRPRSDLFPTKLETERLRPKKVATPVGIFLNRPRFILNRRKERGSSVRVQYLQRTVVGELVGHR